MKGANVWGDIKTRNGKGHMTRSTIREYILHRVNATNSAGRTIWSTIREYILHRVNATNSSKNGRENVINPGTSAIRREFKRSASKNDILLWRGIGSTR